MQIRDQNKGKRAWKSRCIGDVSTGWYIFNVSIIFDCSVLFCDQSWMFWNEFLSTLYQFLVLTYWHSAKCQLLFSALFLIHRKSISNGVQTQRNFLWNFSGPEDTRRIEDEMEWRPWVGTTHQGAPGGPGTPWWVVAHSGTPSTASLLYKYSNIPNTLEESPKNNSSRLKFQNHQIQSRHHLGGFHHVYCCLSDDPWVVHCRPSGP
jgi:hypothetical protein